MAKYFGVAHRRQTGAAPSFVVFTPKKKERTASGRVGESTPRAVSFGSNKRPGQPSSTVRRSAPQVVASVAPLLLDFPGCGVEGEDRHRIVEARVLWPTRSSPTSWMKRFVMSEANLIGYLEQPCHFEL